MFRRGLRACVASLAIAATLIACGSSESDTGDRGAGPSAGEPAGDPVPGAGGVVVQIGADVLPAVAERFVTHVRSVRPDARVLAPDATLDGLGRDALVLAIGRSPASEAVIPPRDVDALGAEGYVIRSSDAAGPTVLAARGKPGARDRLGIADRGTLHAAYAVLEQIGFGFLHPLSPTKAHEIARPGAPVSRREEPRWPIRGLQLHTMHPLELTDLLNGFGPSGPTDAAGWEAMLPEWDRFLEWMLANGQNRVHWVLLEAASWSAFAQSEERRLRLQRLAARAHAFGIAVGADVPIALEQQHTFRLVTKKGDLASELPQLRARVDWLMSAGFDYLATENGTTEFSHPEAARMLAYLDELAKHVDERHHKPAYVKIHCSTGQTAAGYPDPVSGKPINFNFLPHFADARLGVMPHTVQHYGLDDPAPTYGNTDFRYMHDFLKAEVGRREVVWHPETAYWVSFDVDVPLFLPVYAERRVHDLRLLAADEDEKRMGLGAHAGGRMDGQLTFSSGWEWGYWLNDVVTARAAWNPRASAANDDAALREILDVALRPFGDAAADVRDLVVDTARMERERFIRGKAGGKTPASTVQRNAQAYLQGVDTWDDVSDLAKSVPGIPFAAQMTQPDKIGLVEMRNPLRLGPRYTGEVETLLAETELDLATLATRWAAIRPRVPAEARDLFDDLEDAAKITWLRARQVHALYDYVDRRAEPNPAGRLARLAVARSALDDAAVVVKQREPRYRVPADRIAAWRPNPTAYAFGYLWTVRSLFYFWRDEGKAVDAPTSPCYGNILSMADIGMGEGALQSGTVALRAFFEDPARAGDFAECAAAPATEPTFPAHGLRTRP